ncbi:MAG: glycosyltransferase family 4 protein [Zavarzinella sp.]
MKKVILFTESLTQRDAVGNDVLGMFRTLTHAGYDAHLCANYTNVSEKVLRPNQAKYLLEDPNNVAVYHLSLAWPNFLDAFLESKAKLIIRYHNITPSKYFRTTNAHLAAMCDVGRTELAKFAARPGTKYLPASQFNESELLALDVPPSNSHVVPPFHVVGELIDLTDDPATLEEIGKSEVNFLAVGRLVPNKGHDMLLQAFAVYYHWFNRNARLHIIGKEDPQQPLYGEMLRHTINTLGIAGAVVFTGSVSPEALKTYYNHTTAYMLVSEHEGFCVPAVEAMALACPLVSYASSAIPGTVGDAGLVWKDFRPELFASSLNHLITNTDLRNKLIQAGKARYNNFFSEQAIQEQFLGSFRALCNEQETPKPMAAECLSSSVMGWELEKADLESILANADLIQQKYPIINLFSRTSAQKFATKPTETDEDRLSAFHQLFIDRYRWGMRGLEQSHQRGEKELGRTLNIHTDILLRQKIQQLGFFKRTVALLLLPIFEIMRKVLFRPQKGFNSAISESIAWTQLTLEQLVDRVQELEEKLTTKSAK